jgi:hypothetical protein
VEDYFEKEEEEQQQQQQASAEVATTNIGQRNHQPVCAAVCVLLVAQGRAHSVPDVTWACVECLVRGISHKSKFVIYHPLCEHCVIQGAADLMQQPELCNELFTPHFI